MPPLRNRVDIEKAFTYAPPKGDQAERYNEITEKTKELAHLYFELMPGSPEATTALRCLQEARMWANCAIATNE